MNYTGHSEMNAKHVLKEHILKATYRHATGLTRLKLTTETNTQFNYMHMKNCLDASDVGCSLVCGNHQLFGVLTSILKLHLQIVRLLRLKSNHNMCMCVSLNEVVWAKPKWTKRINWAIRRILTLFVDELKHYTSLSSENYFMLKSWMEKTRS